MQRKTKIILVVASCCVSFVLGLLVPIIAGRQSADSLRVRAEAIEYDLDQLAARERAASNLVGDIGKLLDQSRAEAAKLRESLESARGDAAAIGRGIGEAQRTAVSSGTGIEAAQDIIRGILSRNGIEDSEP